MIIGGYSNKFRIGGLATGLDTDTMVKQLMQVERMPVDKLFKKKALLEWKRDDYRSITDELRAFKNEFMDIANSTNYVLSRATFKKFSVSSTDSTVVTATGNIDAASGSHTIRVDNLATQAYVQSSASLSKEIEGSSAADFVAAQGKVITMTVDGVERDVEIDATVIDIATFNDKIDEVFGAGKILVEDIGAGELRITPAVGGGSNKIVLDSTSSAWTDLGFDSNTVTSNRILASQSLESISDSLNIPFTFVDDKVTFSINGEDFEFDKTDTLTDVMNDINANEEAKVEMRYDEVTDTFKFTADQYGAGTTLEFSDTTGNFFAAFALDSVNTVAGEDAEILYDGQLLKRSSNTFDISGVNYTLLKESATTQTIGLSLDVDGIYDTIESFIDKYNEILGKINSKMGEEYDRDYLPLTDEEKEAMSEDDIETWEEKAKTGLLRNDPLLQNLSYKLRKAVQDSISGISGLLSDIGIESTSWKDKGKLTIDETKLKAAITNNPDKVMNLLAKSSDNYPSYYGLDRVQANSTAANALQDYSVSNKSFGVTVDGVSKTITLDGNYTTYSDLTSDLESKLTSAFTSVDGDMTFEVTQTDGVLRIMVDEVGEAISVEEPTSGTSALSDLGLTATTGGARQVRYNEEGVFQRIADVLEENISIYRNKSGERGTFIEKAGYAGESSEYDNTIFNQTLDYQTDIEEMWERLYKKEDAYYKQFTAMEKAIQDMNNQMNWFMSQLGGTTSA